VGPAPDNNEPRLARTEYQRLLEERRRDSAQLATRERIVGNGKVLVFLALVALGVAAASLRSPLLGWLTAPPALALLALLLVHENVTRAWHRAGRAVAFYQAGLNRLDGRWQGRGQQGTRFLDEHHPYAADLDLFGSGSIFELLCTARTRAGEDTLADWLKGPAGPDEVAARQAAVAELKAQLLLREDLALLGGDLPAGLDFSALAEWGASDPVLTVRWPRFVAPVLGTLAIVTLVGWLLTTFQSPEALGPLAGFFERYGSGPFVVVAVLELCLAGWLLGPVQRVLGAVEQRGRDLTLLAHVLERLEAASFASPRLRELKALLEPAGLGARPSQCIAQLVNRIDLLNMRHAMLFAPFAYLMLWGTQSAYALEAWRRRCGKSIAPWLHVVGQTEALCSLAAYAFENPDDPFPEVVAARRGFYEGEALGHPLLPSETCVRNDLQLSGELRVLVVSGSNMSGKSTFLRTVGVNAVLALAGAPVRARRLRLTPLAIGATLRIQDSLQGGVSRFKAEVLRVRQVVDLAQGETPLLFLLDEIFAGTNSHDRRIGAEAVVRGLVEAGAIGLVTTHDLTLTKIADDLGPKAANVHFADRLEEGLLHFDYRLRPGVVQHSNALALMRAVGLKI
jgi:hypothetical protein